MVQQGEIDGFRASRMIQDKAQPAGNGRVLFEGCDADVDHPACSLQASREAVVRGVAPLGKDAPLPAKHALRLLRPPGATASQLAACINFTLLDR